MKITLFNRKKYTESLRKLNKRNAPSYVIEAYKEGYSKVVNEFYRKKLDRRLGKAPITESFPDLFEHYKGTKINFLGEALTVKDLEFIKAFFKMTNLDMVSGNRLPPNASNLIKQSIPKDFGLKDLFKKLR